MATEMGAEGAGGERMEFEELCGRAGLSPRQREVLRLTVAGKNAAEVAEELKMREGTVGVHLHRAKRKLRREQERHELREFYGVLLYEVLPGPRPSNPKAGLYRELRPGEGERVRLHASLVTVEELVRQEMRRG